MRPLAAALACPLLSLLATCTPKPPQLGGVGAEDDPNVAKETGRASVLVVDGPTAPLIVDWQSDDRLELEAAMKQGVAVVAFDSKALRLLKHCRVDGSYGFIGVTTKYQMVRLESSDEVRANLPLGGPVLLAKLGAELGRSRTLDVAMALIGKLTTTWNVVTPEDLQGECKGATHYVRGATIGAFVLETGQKNSARAAAEVLGAGASYAKGSSREVHNKDGSLDACKIASSEANVPPDQCRALVRIELEPISRGVKPAGDAAREARSAAATECPPPLVLSEGKCASPENVTAKLCAPTDAADCDKQCSAGHPESCNRFAILLHQGRGVARDQPRADALYLKACEMGSPYGCVNASLARYDARPAEALTLALKGCDEGVAFGCRIAGELLHLSPGVPRDTRRALRLYTLACNGGDESACTNVGLLYAGAAADIPKDELKGIGFTKRACDGGVSAACGNLGLKYEFGVVVKQDPAQAVALFERACRMDPADCLRIGIAHQAGFGVKRDDAMARQYFERSCKSPGPSFSALSCAVLNLSYGASEGLARDALERVQPIMHPQCEQDVPRACTFLAVSHLALGKRSSGEMYLAAGCKMKDYWACDLQKRLAAKK